MKKYILFLIVGMFLINLGVIVFAENCELATPRYGVVQCVNTNQRETQTTTFGSFDGEWSITNIPCLSNCEVSASGINIDCTGVPWDVSEIWLNEQKQNSFPILWNRGDELVVKGKCTNLITNSAVPSNSQITYQQDQIMLQEGWAGSLPDTPVTGSEGCVLNKNYDTTNINSYFDPTTSQTKSKQDYSLSTYSSLSQFPNNWKIGDHFIFVKEWQTGIADISLTYDKNNNSYWCGGQYGSRTIYNVEQVTSPSGQCYDIPQSVSISNAECCFPSDCVSKGAEYTCNPDNWKCEQTKPCNSQLDCDQTFGEGVCQNDKINQWVCDLTKKWGDYAGTCVHSEKQVTECPSNCNSNQYYNEEQGKCLTRAGLTEKNINSSANGSSPSYTTSQSSTGTVILIIFLIIVGGSIGFFVYVKRKKKGHHKEEKEIKHLGKHCTKCGHPLKAGSKFCTKCGKKL